ncbi:MAG TPA: LysM peptidoglycan-binding domain-containing protein [Vicinamibacterales bacterium]|nr:LysM peptidoglycan-binding domain-containing protein [Vicinamibacterales bacterium]
MLRPRFGAAGAICALALITASCSSKKPIAPAKPAVAAPTVAPVVVPPPQPAPYKIEQQGFPIKDPALDLIAQSNQLFEAGQRQLEQGHLQAARDQFNRALDVLFESPGGARTNPQIREHFDRMVERISAAELTSLAQGDGFAEGRAEPASIDELLAISTFAEEQPTQATTDAVTEDLEVTAHDIDIPLNAKVLSFVEMFSGRAKNYLEDGLNRGRHYLPMIQEVFRAEGLPLDLAYVPLIESAFKPSAVSRAKAKGIWQFMRGTAIENGLKHDWYIDERADPEKATRAAAKYLKTLYGMFGDWHLALASYNGGPGRVQKAMRQSGKDDFWSLTARGRYLPRETRDYVPLILAAVVVAKNPGQYGMTVQSLEEDERGIERVTLTTAVDLRVLAEWIGTPVQTIQELNPELRRWTTPVRATDYELKVPAGTADVVRARLLESEPAELAPLNRHMVKKGETLLSIARQLKVTRSDLAEANYLSSKATLKVGQQLIIPRAPTLLLAARPDTPSSESRDSEAAPAPAAVAAATRTADSTVIHRVKSGETLFSIARLYRTTVGSLKEWNRLRSNSIRAGQRLTIHATRTVATN